LNEWPFFDFTSQNQKMATYSLDLLRWVSEMGKRAIFFPHEGFLREHSPAI
jgi:hypothetical protein